MEEMTLEERVLELASYLNKRIMGIPGSDEPEGTLNITLTISKTLAMKWRNDLIEVANLIPKEEKADA